MLTAKRSIVSITLTASLAAMLISISTPKNFRPASRGITGGTRQRALQTYGKLPLVFEDNHGQVNAEVKFLSRAKRYSVFLTSTETVFSNGVRIKLRDANPTAPIEGLEKTPGVSHYFAGNDPAKWRSHVSHYARLRYRGVYPGVDVEYYGSQENIEHDFIVAPGADPRQIRFAVNGADRVELRADGDLAIQTAGDELRLRKPAIYQVDAAAKRSIDGHYLLAADNEVTFALANYDPALPLVIDPVLIYSTYLGGSLSERFPSIVADDAGNAYVAGTTSSLDFPVKNALLPKHSSAAGSDTFVTKLNAAGELVFSTYLGRSGFQGSTIAVDRAGNLYVGAVTSGSTDVPVTPNAFQPTYGGGSNCGWVGKLSGDGSKLVYGTFLGGSGRDRVLAIAVDAGGNAVVAGETMSSNFPTANPVQASLRGTNNGFVAKLSADGSKLLYSTYLGGSKDERVFFVRVDDQGSAYIVGRTSSTDFPVVNALQKTYGGGPDDGFLAKLSADGSNLLFSTYLGGSGDDSASGIALDAAGNIYVTGATSSLDFPIRNALQGALGGGLDAFVTKITPDGSAIVYSTYFGGSGNENAIEDVGVIAVDAAGYIYIAGQTGSLDFPTFNAIQPAYGGNVDGFVAALAPDGSALVYSSYLGGSAAETMSGLGLDSAGNVYVSGNTASSDFPTFNAAQKNNGGGASDAFIAKIGPISRYFAVSTASGNAPLAVESLASFYGTGLTKDAVAGNPQSPGTSLGGIGLRVRDSIGVARMAPLLYVSPSQINFEVPDGTAPGNATLEVVNAVGTVQPVVVPVRSLAPGIFTLKNNTAAAYGVRVEADGTQTVLNPGTPIVIDNRTVYLVLFGTGFRYRSSVANVKCTIGGITVPVEYAGPGGGIPGLDQVNARLTSALKGNTDGHLVLTVDGVVANVVRVDVH